MKDREFMVKLSTQGGCEEDMLEYLNAYVLVKKDDYNKEERDMISVTIKKHIRKERKSLELLDALVDQPKLKRFEANMRQYIEKLKDEAKMKMVEILQLLQTSCLAQAENRETKAFFLSLIGDFYRYQIELIRLDENVPME